MESIVQTGAKEVELQDRNRPTLEADEVLVRVHTAGICGSDVHAYKYEDGFEWIKIPRIMGHEYSGTVVEVGDEVTAFQPGDKVVEEPIHDCGECFQCKNGDQNVCENFSITGMHRDGAWTEYTTTTPNHLHPVPDGVTLRDAAITEPTSIATRAVFTQSEVTPGDNILVQGPGPIGFLTAVVADTMGANVIVSGLGRDRTHRLPMVEEAGIDTIDIENEDLAERRDELANGGGFDVVFDTTGHKSGTEMAIEHTRRGGQIVVVGLPGEPSELFMTPVVRGEIDLNTSYGSTWTNFEQALRLMEMGAVSADEFVDDSFSRENPEAAFDAFLESRVIKPIFTFDD